MDNMVKTLCVVQARLTSSRLPKKVLMELGDSHLSIAEHVYARLQKASRIDEIVFAIPDTSLNDELAAFLARKHIPYFRGSEDDVLARFYTCAAAYNPELVVRATCDNPCVDWQLADQLIEQLGDADYIYCKEAPLGTSVEVFRFAALEEAYRQASQPRDHEHVTPYIIRNNQCKDFHPAEVLNYRLTVDEEADFELMNLIYKTLYHGAPVENRRIYDFLKENPAVLEINGSVRQKKV